ncbi:MAG: hypothetical protein OXC81_01855 [Betaproteobacteria bacterium]|nr:hypothetical protein [Betaproteobacteria bacterium]
MEVGGVANQPGALAPGAAAAAPEPGSLGGLAVAKAAPAAQLLADLQEEISFAHSERAENDEEAEEALEDRANRVREKLIERIRDVYKAAEGGNEQQNSRQEMLEKLKSGHYKSPDDLLEELGQRSEDRAEIFYLLTSFGDDLEPGSAAAELVGDALIAAASDWEPEIVAGGNTLAQSAAVAERTGLEQDELQRAYQDTIVSYESVITTLAELTAKFGLDRVEDGADFLQEAARADLISQPSSVEPERLERTLLELQGMKIYHTFRENVEAAYTRAVGGDERLGQLAHDWVMTRFISSLSDPSDFDINFKRRVPEDARIQARVLLLQDLKGAISETPEHYFTSGGKDRAMSPWQTEIDRLIYQEAEE